MTPGATPARKENSPARVVAIARKNPHVRRRRNATATSASTATTPTFAIAATVASTSAKNADHRRAGPESSQGSGRRRNRRRTSHPGTNRGQGSHIPTKNEEPQPIQWEKHHQFQSMVGVGYNVPRILPRDRGLTKDCMDRNPPNGHSPVLAPPSLQRTGRCGHLGQLLSSDSGRVPQRPRSSRCSAKTGTTPIPGVHPNIHNGTPVTQ